MPQLNLHRQKHTSSTRPRYIYTLKECSSIPSLLFNGVHTPCTSTSPSAQARRFSSITHIFLPSPRNVHSLATLPLDLRQSTSPVRLPPPLPCLFTHYMLTSYRDIVRVSTDASEIVGVIPPSAFLNSRSLLLMSSSTGRSVSTSGRFVFTRTGNRGL